MSSFLIGHGYDIHRLRAGGALTLAGVVVSNEFSPIAHSDGDVILHALVDALLGAIGGGDIGEIFPPSDAKWKNAPSRIFVAEAVKRVAAAGYRVVNADITLLLERPRIGSFKPAMRDALRQLVPEADYVNIKAGTNEGCDSVGRGEAVAAHAVVLLSKRS